MPGNLATSAFSALRWNYLGFVIRGGSSFLIGVVLARLLGPKPFGQLALVSVIFGLANQFADAGFSSALVQAPELTNKQIRAAFTVQVLIGGVVAALIICGAPYLALALHAPELMILLRAIAPVFFLQSLGQTATGLLKRKLTFKAVQTAQISSYLTGYLLVGIPGAYLGAGVWSLIAAQIAQSLLYSVQVYAKTRHSVIPSFDRSGLSLFRFGAQMTFLNVTNWSITGLDNAFIGRNCGAAPLGLYNRAFNLASTPADGVVSTFQQVLFAACSRADGQLASIRRAYLAAVAAISLITFPLLWSMAACAHTVVVGFYGARWSGAVPLFVPLALIFPIHALMALSGPILGATNHVRRELSAQIATVVVAIVAFSVAVRYSPATVAWAVVGIYALRCYLVTRPTLKLLGIPGIAMLVAVRGALVVGVITTVSAVMVDRAFLHYRISSGYVVGMLAATGTGTLFAVLVIAGQYCVSPELAGYIAQRGSGFVPEWARVLVKRTEGQVGGIAGQGERRSEAKLTEVLTKA